MKKNKGNLVKGWIEKAEHDFKAAEMIMKSDEILTDIICFHAQQAVEKYLKGYLIYLGMEFDKTHDIEDLIMIAGEKEPLILENTDMGAKLTPFAIETRYPEFEKIHPHDAAEALEIAGKFRDFIFLKLPEEIKSLKKQIKEEKDNEN